MCLILFSYKTHPNYKLVIAANRDEFYKRPTSSADFWKDHKNVLAGRDLEAGGTWMGINKNGALALLTNYRDLSNLKKNAPSRGKLVSDFLVAYPHPKKYLESMDLISGRYNGFNILLGNPDDIWYYSNVGKRIYMLGSGIYGLSNSLLDTPWPKVEKGKRKLNDILNKPSIEPEDLFSALFDDELAADDQLPDTGVGLDKERMLSSMFIKSPSYGTVCSTVLMVDQFDGVIYSEKTYNTSTFESEVRTFDFKITQ